MTILMTSASPAKRVLTLVFVLGGLLLLDGQIGPISFLFRRASAASLIAVLLLVARQNGSRGFATAFLPWLAVVLIWQSPTLILATLGYALALALIAASERAKPSTLSPGTAQTILSYVGLGLVPDLIPQSRMLGEAVSAAARGYLRTTTSVDSHLSFTAMGGPAILLATVYLLWRWRLVGSRGRLLAAILIPLSWFLLLPIVTRPASEGPIKAYEWGAFHGLFWLGCAALIDSVVPCFTHNDAGRMVVGKRRQALMASVGIVSLLVGLTLVGVVNSWSPSPGSILVHNRGGLDWDRPVFGKFGAFSGGMFGLLPVYARGNGYRFEVLDKDKVEPGDLSGYQTLILINSPKVWEGEELRAVREFVAGGGGLLVLGDHTDVFGLMKGFNTLLEGFGIQFRFDSAYHARPGWRGCLSPAPDAVTTGWDLDSPMVAIGASLELRGGARPLLTGRFGHSDIGIRSNVIGSYLGNYTYENGEQLGDLALIASTTYGRGRVIVLGDTSPFQGGQSYSFSRTSGRLLALLSRPTNLLDQPLWRGILATAWLALLLLSWGFRSGDRFSVAVLGTLLAGVGGGWALSEHALSSPVAVGPDCVLIDDSHLPAVGHYEEKVNPSGPLDTNLLRSGLRVANLDHWDRATLSRARGIAFIAPQRPFSKSEVDDLLRFEAGGGVVLLAVGQPDSSASRPVLLAHGLDLAGRPLGTVPDTQTLATGPGGRERETPRFLDAWPIVDATGGDPSTIPGVEVLYRDGKDVIALFRRRGRGGLLLIADTRFFSNMNIEDVSGHRVGNLALIHDIFRMYLGTDPDSVRPLFPSPKKPD